MNYFKQIVMSGSLLWSSALVGGAQKPAPEVYINNGNLVLEENGKVTQFIIPKKLLDNGRYQIRVKRPAVEKNQPPKETLATTLSDRIEARRIMHDANQAYYKGEIAKTWDLVAKAEKLDPKFYRVITMKGSLLYKIGSEELAAEVWQKSLQQNPDQPEIAKLIDKILKQTATKSGAISNNLSSPSNKKVIN
jgi:hypothetical protein